MGFEPWRPQGRGGHASGEDFKPADEDIIRTLAEIEKVSTPLPSATSDTSVQAGTGGQSGPGSAASVNAAWRSAAIAIGAAAGFVILGLNFLGRQTSSGQSRRGPARVISRSSLDPALQAEAEQLLQKVVTGDPGAADHVLTQSSHWTGKTRRTAQSEQFIGTALNLPDLHAREAALRAEMALDGVTADESGFVFAEQAVGNPSSRVWALWMLGALGNRGVDPEHAAKVIGTYLTDAQVDVRAAAVNGLSLLGTDETIPVMLDRFRNDPSPTVQERAACSLAESGMYRHEQRMTAAASFVSWLDDPRLSAPQREWALHALRDIAGQNFGNDSSAWRAWFDEAR
jgi:HEAT repeats